MSSDASEVPAAAVPGESVHWYHSLRTRIALWSGLTTLAFLLGVTLATAWYLYREILDSAQRDTRATTIAAAGRLDDNLRTLTVATANLALLVSRSSLTPEQLRQAQLAVVESIPGAAGALLAVEPQHPGEVPYARYIGAGGRLRDFVADGYDYRTQDWYRRTQVATGGWWSEPYLNRTAGQVWMATYNVPLQPPGSGMASLDMRIEDVVAPVESLAHLPGMRVTLVAPEGSVAFSTVPDIVLRGNLDAYIASGRSDLKWAADAARENRTAHRTHRDRLTGQMRFTAVEPVGDSGWVLLVGQTYDPIIAHFRRALLVLVGTSLVLALLGMLLVRQVGKQISRPVEELSRSAVEAIAGDTDAPLAQQRRRDEVGMLARTLERARQSIRRQLREIEQMGAARQKLESELSIARDIQRAMLPLGRTIDRGGGHLEAQALLEPAKAVGGDFYNFIERGSELWFVIGDVSDKGVPAALFMARAVTMLEVAIQTATSPAHALAEASRRLVQGNDTCMFATVLCGRVDIRGGTLWLASAGHEPPLLLHGDGRLQTVRMENGPSLGFEVSDDFPLWQGRLAPGDCLVAYTDGVTEAFNLADEAYGNARLEQVLARHGDLGAGDACARVLADVHRFVAGAPPSDDTTIVAISRSRDLDNPRGEAHAVGAKGEISVHFSEAHTSEDVLRMTDAIDALLARHGASAAAMHDARLIVEEVACNAVEHAVADGAPLEMRARVDADRLWLEFRDRGGPFDPTLAEGPDLDADIDTRPVGGLGVHLVRELADSIDYQRNGDCNLLRITLRLDAASDMESPA